MQQDDERYPENSYTSSLSRSIEDDAIRHDLQQARQSASVTSTQLGRAPFTGPEGPSQNSASVLRWNGSETPVADKS